MDPSLLRERENFKRKASELPNVAKRIRVSPLSQEPPINARKPLESNPVAVSSSKPKLLCEVVVHMKKRHLAQDKNPLSLNEILEEIGQPYHNDGVKNWLIEALNNNEKIEVSQEGNFRYKPTYNIHDGKGLVKLLRKFDLKGWGGILLDDVKESLPNWDKVLDQREKYISYVTRPDKKVIMFYNDSSCDLVVEESFQNLWRSLSVQHVDDEKIETYLTKNGISSMKQQPAAKKFLAPVRKKRSAKKGVVKKRDNDHLADILENYE